MARMLGKVHPPMCPVCRSNGRKDSDSPGVDCTIKATGTREQRHIEKRGIDKALRQLREEDL